MENNNDTDYGCQELKQQMHANNCNHQSGAAPCAHDKQTVVKCRAMKGPRSIGSPARRKKCNWQRGALGQCGADCARPLDDSVELIARLDRARTHCAQRNESLLGPRARITCGSHESCFERRRRVAIAVAIAGCRRGRERDQCACEHGARAPEAGAAVHDHRQAIGCDDGLSENECDDTHGSCY